MFATSTGWLLEHHMSIAENIIVFKSAEEKYFNPKIFPAMGQIIVPTEEQAEEATHPTATKVEEDELR